MSQSQRITEAELCRRLAAAFFQWEDEEDRPIFADCKTLESLVGYNPLFDAIIQAIYQELEGCEEEGFYPEPLVNAAIEDIILAPMLKKLREFSIRLTQMDAGKQIAYLDASGQQCPQCGAGGENLKVGGEEVDAGTRWENVECIACGSRWTDVYQLIGYTEAEFTERSAGGDEQNEQ